MPHLQEDAALLLVTFGSNVTIHHQPAQGHNFKILNVVMYDTSSSTGKGPHSTAETMRVCLAALLEDLGLPALTKPIPVADGRTKLIEAMVVADARAKELCAAHQGSVRGTTVVFTDGWENDSFIRKMTLTTPPLAGPQAKHLYAQLPPIRRPDWGTLENDSEEYIAKHVAYFANETKTNVIICVGAESTAVTMANNYNDAALSRAQGPIIAAVATDDHWDPVAIKTHMHSVVSTVRSGNRPKTVIVKTKTEQKLKMPKPGSQAHEMIGDMLAAVPQRGTTLTVRDIPFVVAECNSQRNNKCWHPIGKPPPNIDTITAVASFWLTGGIPEKTPFTIAKSVKEMNKMKGSGGIPTITPQEKSALNSLFAKIKDTYPESLTVDNKIDSAQKRTAVAYIITKNLAQPAISTQ